MTNIDRVHGHLGGPQRVASLDDPLVADAVERCLERISEAVARLMRAGVPLHELAPGVRWSDIRSFGNVLRHEYGNIDPLILRSTIIDRLPELRAAVETIKARL